jgi:hypothetical protein
MRSAYKSTFTLTILIAFFICGFQIIKNSNNFNYSEVQGIRSVSRDPAAIKKVYDFSNLDGVALDQASKQRLISGAKVIQEKGDIGIELGHFVLRGADGQKSFACQLYSKITLVFEGDGMAIGGEKPSMEVEGSCEISADINAISPLWIPVGRILGEPVAECDFDFREGRPAKVHFSNVQGEWPTVWRLKTVHLSQQQMASNEVTIGDNELRQYSQKPFIISFK